METPAYRPVARFAPEGEAAAAAPPARPLDAPDRRDGRVYVEDPGLHLALNVALATGRPLLLRGKPGSGKSSYASYAARRLNYRYYEQVVSARTQAEDLLWTFDPVRRLGDAQVVGAARGRRAGTGAGGDLLNDFDYIIPGPFWWALNRESAARRGAPKGVALKAEAPEPFAAENAGRDKVRAVVLIDEIDKGDPDVPNNLLVPLGSLEFCVAETGAVVRRPAVAGKRAGGGQSSLLVVVTTNEERDLPDAFLRRCVVHELKHPDARRLAEIAAEHFRLAGEAVKKAEESLFEAVAQRVVHLRGQAEEARTRPPSTAEFLDAVWACHRLKVTVGHPVWADLEGMILLKSRSLHQDDLP
jgi:MoxR-like ATPase